MLRFLQILVLIMVASCAAPPPLPRPAAAPLPAAESCRLILCRNVDYPWPWDSLQPWGLSQELLVDSACQSWGVPRSQVQRLDGDPLASLPLISGFDGPLLIAITGHVLEQGQLLLPDRRRISLPELISILEQRQGPTWLILDTCHAGFHQPVAGSQLLILSVCAASELSREIRLSAARLPDLRREFSAGRQWIAQQYGSTSISPLGLALAQIESRGWPSGDLDAKLKAIVEEGRRLNSLPGFGNQSFDLRGFPNPPTGR